MFLTVNVRSTKSPTRTASKFNKFSVLSLGNFNSTLISNASASILMSFGSLIFFKPSVSSATSFKISLNFCCLMALKVTSIVMLSLGLSLPCLMLTENSAESFSQPYSLKSTGMALVFLIFSSLLIVWFKRILVNLRGAPSRISIDGLEP